MSESRRMGVIYDGKHRTQVYSPEINSMIEDSNYLTSFKDYMIDLKFDFKHSQCEIFENILEN